MATQVCFNHLNFAFIVYKWLISHCKIVFEIIEENFRLNNSEKRLKTMIEKNHQKFCISMRIYSCGEKKKYC